MRMLISVEADHFSTSPNRNSSNGVLLMSRYSDSGDTLYYAGMRVDDAERLVLLLQLFDQPRQHRVLQHVGVVPRMIGVTVVHPRNTKKAPAQISEKPMMWFTVMAWPR